MLIFCSSSETVFISTYWSLSDSDHQQKQNMLILLPVLEEKLTVDSNDGI